MSRGPSRYAAEAIALVFLAVVVVATMLLSGSVTMFLSVVCAGCGAVVAYQLVTRRRWSAVGTALISAQPVVNLINHDVMSPFQHDLTVGLQLAGAAIAMVTLQTGQRIRARERQRRSGRGSDLIRAEITSVDAAGRRRPGR